MSQIAKVPNILLRLAPVAVSGLLLVSLWLFLDGAAALRTIRNADMPWLVLAWMLLSVQTVISALRWKFTAAQLGQTFSNAEAVSEYYRAQFVNQSLPGGVVGDAGRAVRARRQAGLLRAAQAVMFERLAGQAAVFLIMASAFMITLAVPGGLTWPLWAKSFAISIIGAGFCLPVALWLTRYLSGGQRSRVQDQWSALVVALLAPNVLPRQAALSVATAACNLAAFAFCARAMGTVLSLAEILTLVPLILFTMLIPISVSGWGMREGAAVALFPVAGASGAAGFAASIAFGLVFVVAALPGVLPVLLGHGPLRRCAATSRSGM